MEPTPSQTNMPLIHHDDPPVAVLLIPVLALLAALLGAWFFNQ